MNPRHTEPPVQIDTAAIGPTCCGHFATGKTLCAHCVTNGLYKNAICFTKPSVGKGADYGTQREQTAPFAGGET